MITLKIGRRDTKTFATIGEAVRFYVKARQESFEGASTFPQGTLIVDGKKKYRVSYNGRVWDKDGVEFVG